MPNTNSDTLEKVETNARTARPSQYDVIMWNDDVTPMDCVVIILLEAFQKDMLSALNIMMDIHHSDRGLIGTYPLEEAYSRVDVAKKLKDEMGIPLLITVEKH